MRRLLFPIACSLVLTAIRAAQQSGPQAPQMPPNLPAFSPAELAAKVPAPRPEDVKSLDAIMHAIYDVISGPVGSRDWNRFRSLFLPQARFTQTSPSPEGKGVIVISWGIEEFIRDAGEVFAKEGFFENAIVNKPEVYGNIAQVFSSYESRHKPAEKPFERGINSVQLLNDGQRWWVVSILWDSEREGNPLPRKFEKE
jgi:hypothetical protein